LAHRTWNPVRTWIASVPPEQATGRLREVYSRIARPGGEVDNILIVHGLRPHTLQGHLALYKAVLHHSANTLPGWLLETVGVYVSLLNGCAYCVDHHAVGLAREMTTGLLSTRSCRRCGSRRPPVRT
jgi:AhpD family alkylhydroperoxidase